jgi:hypothetical protein
MPGPVGDGKLTYCPGQDRDDRRTALSISAFDNSSRSRCRRARIVSVHGQLISTCSTWPGRRARGRASARHGRQRDVCADEPLQRPLHVGHHLIQRDDPRRHRPAPAERKQLTRGPAARSAASTFLDVGAKGSSYAVPHEAKPMMAVS